MGLGILLEAFNGLHSLHGHGIPYQDLGRLAQLASRDDRPVGMYRHGHNVVGVLAKESLRCLWNVENDCRGSSEES